MSFKVQDPVFNSQGEPGIVKQINRESQKIKVDKDQKTVAQEFRHGYLKGMSEGVRSEFNQFMDDVKNEQIPKEKVTMLQGKISELEADFSPKNYILLNYLKSELAHVMNTYHVQPRTFEAKEENLF